MRLPALVASLLAVFFVGGCASAVSPLYLKTDAVADPAVIGTWIGAGNNEHAIVHIEQMKNGSYQITVHDTESGDDSIYDANLVKLGGASFADLLLTSFRHAGQNVDLPGGVVALHQIVKYQITGDGLSFSVIDGNALDKSAKQPGFSLQLRNTEGTGGDTIILSTTDELRRYFSAHPSDIFEKPTVLHRQR